jgi:hypothetical protein
MTDPIFSFFRITVFENYLRLLLFVATPGLLFRRSLNTGDLFFREMKMATLILNTEAAVMEHALRMKLGDVYVLPRDLVTPHNVCKLMMFFSSQKVVVFINQVSFYSF